MDKLPWIGILIGFYGPIFLMIYWTIKRVHKLNEDEKIDAKRRKTFKIVEKE